MLFATIIVIALFAFFGPEEESLGANVRIVYLHGAWVLAAELAMLMAGLAILKFTFDLSDEELCARWICPEPKSCSSYL